MYGETEAEKNIYKFITELSMKMGMNMLFSKIHTIVFLHPKEISLEELAEYTGYSLSSVSNTVKHLEMMKKIRRVKQPGTKKVFVKGEKNLISSMNAMIEQSIHNVLIPMQQILPITIKELKLELKKPKISKERKAELEEKINWYACYFDQNQRMEEIFSKVKKQLETAEQDYQRSMKK